MSSNLNFTGDGEGWYPYNLPRLPYQWTPLGSVELLIHIGKNGNSHFPPIRLWCIYILITLIWENLCMFYGHCLVRVKGLFQHLVCRCFVFVPNGCFLTWNSRNNSRQDLVYFMGLVSLKLRDCLSLLNSSRQMLCICHKLLLPNLERS